MKILVTGANGYLRHGVADELLKRGNEVVATDFACDHVNLATYCVPGDIFSIEDPCMYFSEPDVVLRLAWRDGFVHNSNARFEDLPKHVASLKKLYESGIQQVAYIGSVHEVGFHEDNIDAHTSCWPMNMYGIAKDALHNALQAVALQSKVKLQWFRGYYIVSDTRYGSSIFSKIVAAKIEGKRELPLTADQNQYDSLDYPNFYHRVVATINRDEALGIINVCSDKPKKLTDRVERFIAENGFSIRLKYDVFPNRPYNSKTV